MIQILIVEDEKAISDLIRINLESEGYECRCAYDGMEAADLIEANHFDLILLDIMLPQVDGYELLSYIKPTNTPVIFLTAKGSTMDKVKGLSMGAEDYIVKPFEVVELLARVQVILRRFHKLDSSLSFQDIHIDVDTRVATKNGIPLTLTPKEYELLVLFIRNVNITLFRDKIYESIWESEFDTDTRTLDLHIQRLRKKVGLEEYLKTIYKVGYRLESGELH